jgi:galactoside O-acetyltransferase
MMAFLARDQLLAMGFAALGDDVRISEKASLHNAAAISLGSGVRIDDFCVLSAGVGGISVGNRVHIGTQATLIGAGRITLSDFTNLSGRVSIYSSSDDFHGTGLTGPMVPIEYRRVRDAAVHLGRHVIVGCGSVILPGAILEDGVAVGALSLVKERCAGFGLYAGIPAKRIGERSRGLLELERQLTGQTTPGE